MTRKCIIIYGPSSTRKNELLCDKFARRSWHREAYRMRECFVNSLGAEKAIINFPEFAKENMETNNHKYPLSYNPIFFKGLASDTVKLNAEANTSNNLSIQAKVSSNNVKQPNIALQFNIVGVDDYITSKVNRAIGQNLKTGELRIGNEKYNYTIKSTGKGLVKRLKGKHVKLKITDSNKTEIVTEHFKLKKFDLNSDKNKPIIQSAFNKAIAKLINKRNISSTENCNTIPNSCKGSLRKNFDRDKLNAEFFRKIAKHSREIEEKTIALRYKAFPQDAKYFISLMQNANSIKISQFVRLMRHKYSRFPEMLEYFITNYNLYTKEISRRQQLLIIINNFYKNIELLNYANEAVLSTLDFYFRNSNYKSIKLLLALIIAVQRSFPMISTMLLQLPLAIKRKNLEPWQLASKAILRSKAEICYKPLASIDNFCICWEMFSNIAFLLIKCKLEHSRNYNKGKNSNFIIKIIINTLKIISFVLQALKLRQQYLAGDDISTEIKLLCAKPFVDTISYFLELKYPNIIKDVYYMKLKDLAKSLLVVKAVSSNLATAANKYMLATEVLTFSYKLLDSSYYYESNRPKYLLKAHNVL